MKNNIDHQMAQFLKGLFPDRSLQDTYEEIGKHGEDLISELAFLKKEKDAGKTNALKNSTNL